MTNRMNVMGVCVALLLPGCIELSSWDDGEHEPSCDEGLSLVSPEPGELGAVEGGGCFLSCSIAGTWAVGAESELTFEAPLGTGEPLSVSSSDDSMLAVEQVSTYSDACHVKVTARLAPKRAGTAHLVVSRGGTSIDRFPIEAREPQSLTITEGGPFTTAPPVQGHLCTESLGLALIANLHDSSGAAIQHGAPGTTWDIDGTPVESWEAFLPFQPMVLGSHRITATWRHLSTAIDVEVVPPGTLATPGFVCGRTEE